jgi:hypothetical protein
VTTSPLELIIPSSNTKERLDSKTKSMLSSYLDQMVARFGSSPFHPQFADHYDRRGSLEVKSAEPKRISLEFLRPDFLQGPQLAQDEESKVLQAKCSIFFGNQLLTSCIGDSLNDFFNMAPNNPSPEKDNEEIQTISQDMMDGWMTALKAGKECSGLPEAPTEHKIKHEANATPAATFLDDLRILIDLVAEPPTERTHDNTFKPTITRLLNEKATLEVVPSPPPHAECEENKSNVASLARGIDNQPCTPLATKRSQIAQCQGAIEHFPTISCSRELKLTASSLVDVEKFINSATPVNVKVSRSEQGSDTAVYPSVGRIYSEDSALASGVLPEKVDTKLSTSAGSELHTQEGTLEDRPAPSSPVATLQKDHSEPPNDDWFDAIFSESPKHGVMSKFSPTPTGATSKSNSSLIKVNVNDYVSHKPRFKRFPTAEEITEEILDPTVHARVLKACGASQEYIDANPVDLQEEAAIRLAFSQKYFHSNVPYDELLKTWIFGQPKLQKVVIQKDPIEGEKKIIRQIQKIRAEQRQTFTTGQEAERQKSGIEVETTSPTSIKQESHEEKSNELFTLKDTSDATIQRLIRPEDQAARTKVTKWCSSQTALHFKTLSDRNSVFDTLPDSVKTASTDPSQVHVTVFPRRLVKATTISLDRYSSKGTGRASPPEMLESLYARESIPEDCLFPQFRKFDKIIRKMIFGLARPGSRFIKLSVCASTRSIYSTASVPSLLHACKESRELALSWYKLSFSTLEYLHSLQRLHWSELSPQEDADQGTRQCQARRIRSPHVIHAVSQDRSILPRC